MCYERLTLLLAVYLQWCYYCCWFGLHRRHLAKSMFVFT